jgi:uncharacterized membrane protein YgcG
MRLTPLRIFAVALLAISARVNLAAASTVNHQLGSVLPELHFDGVSISDAIDFLRDVSGANMTVNWKALEEQGVSKDTPINLKLRQVSLRRALELVLSEVGGPGKLGYTVDENVIEITSQELVDSKMYTRVYPIQDLIMEVPDFDNAPDFSLTSTTTNSGQSGGNGGGGSGTSLFTGGGGGKTEKTTTPAQRANDLIDLIRSTIRPEIWQENGGKAVIRYFNGNLIVTAPRSVQEAIGGTFN